MNMASAVIYIVFFIIIHKKKYEIFTLFCGIEIAAFMTASTMLAGYNAGFQLCLIGLCTLAFVTKFFLKEKRLYFWEKGALRGISPPLEGGAEDR